MSTFFFCSYCVANMGCKVPVIPFAVKMARDLEAEGLLDEAEEYCQLAETLMRETDE